MNATWYCNVKKSNSDIEAYMSYSFSYTNNCLFYEIIRKKEKAQVTKFLNLYLVQLSYMFYKLVLLFYHRLPYIMCI